MSVDDATIKTNHKSAQKKRSIWRWLLWIFLILFLLVAILTALLWVNRYSLMEQAARDILYEQGIEGDLSIQSVSKTQAILKNISLSDEGTEFFSASKITADYTWQDALNGKMKKLVFVEPKARLTLDEQGKIIDGWIPPQREDDTGSKINLPPEGITLQSGEFTIGSPYGDAEAKVDAVIFTQDNFTACLDIASTNFSYKDWQLKGGGKLDIILKGDTPKIDIDVELTTLEHPVIDAEDLHIKGNMVPALTDTISRIEGTLDFTFGQILTAQASSKAGDVSWSGLIERDNSRESPLALEGDWSARANDVSLPDPIRRRELAETLSLSSALLNAPIAQNFSGDLTRNMMSLLEKNNVNAKGRLKLASEGLSVSLLGPARLSSEQTQLTLSQTDWASVYNFSRPEEQVRLVFQADFTKPAGLNFQETDIVATSNNGWRLEGVERFSADISTTQTWRAENGARLSPFKAEAIYKGGMQKRNLRLNGGINYDGTLPGGYAKGLITSGQMNMDLQGSKMTVLFKPSNDTPIRITRFDTDTEWRGEDISAVLMSDTPLYRRNGTRSSMDAKFSDVSLIAIDRPGARNLGMTFDGLDVEGLIKGDHQDWTLRAKTAKVYSEDTPGPGTVIRTPEARMMVQRSGNSDINFTLDAPIANAKTQLVNAQNISITAQGTPENYQLEYSPGTENKGRVKFTGDALPSLPMTGLVNYSGGAFEGTARTSLPEADNTPIDIRYRFENGSGTADVDIPELRFTPNGLQPQSLISALRGKIADVEGAAAAKIKLAFAAGQPLQSSGTAKIIDMNFGTLPGPLQQVNTELTFTSMFPLESEGRQRLTVAQFDPGFPLQNGVIEFALIPDGVKVYSAQWPLGEGYISLDPFDWIYSNTTNRVVMRIEKVSIGEFLKDVGNGSLEVTGDLEGTLPILLSGIDVQVENGELFVKNGGIVRYQSQQTNAAAENNEYAGMAFEALKDLHYRELIIKMDGPLDGSLDVGLKFDGNNKEVLGGQPFLFDVNIQGELLNIARNFSKTPQNWLEYRRLATEPEP